MKTTLLTAFFFISIGAFAQYVKDIAIVGYSAEEKNMVGVKIGVGIPVGKFAKTDDTQDDSGYAKAGLMAELNYARKLNDRYTLMFVARDAAFKFDINTFAAISTRKTKVPWQGTADPWSVLSLCLGGSRTINSTNEKLLVTSKALIGIAFATTPEVILTYGPASIDMLPDNATSPAIILGLGVKYKSNSGKISFLFDADYATVNATFSQQVYYRNGQLFSTGVSHYNQPMNSVNISAGIALNF